MEAALGQTAASSCQDLYSFLTAPCVPACARKHYNKASILGHKLCQTLMQTSL